MCGMLELNPVQMDHTGASSACHFSRRRSQRRTRWRCALSSRGFTAFGHPLHSLHVVAAVRYEGAGSTDKEVGPCPHLTRRPSSLRWASEVERVGSV